GRGHFARELVGAVEFDDSVAARRRERDRCPIAKPVIAERRSPVPLSFPARQFFPDSFNAADFRSFDEFWCGAGYFHTVAAGRFGAAFAVLCVYNAGDFVKLIG